jgi:hypothetical protein
MKASQIFSGLFFLLFLPGTILSQDILFKKDSSVLRVKIQDFDGKTVVYLFPGDSSKIIYHLSASALDSLKYGNGQSIQILSSSAINNVPEKILLRNFFTVEIVSFFAGKVAIDFERSSPNGSPSFVAGLFINTGATNHDYWPDHHYPFQYKSYDPYSFFGRIGVNFYPFNHTLSMASDFRFSTGFSVLAGSRRKIDFNFYDPINEDYTKNVAGACFVWNLREGLLVGNHLQVGIGAEVSILPFLTYVSPQANLSAGF